MTAGRIALRAGAALLALCALLAATYGAAFAHLGAFALPVSMGIATAKAMLVMLIFMEQNRAGPAARFAAAAGVVWLLLLLGLTFADEGTRPRIESPENVHASLQQPLPER